MQLIFADSTTILIIVRGIETTAQRQRVQNPSALITVRIEDRSVSLRRDRGVTR